MEQQVQPVHADLRGHKGFKVLLVLMEHKVLLDHRVLPDKTELMAQMELTAQPDHKGQRELPD